MDSHNVILMRLNVMNILDLESHDYRYVTYAYMHKKWRLSYLVSVINYSVVCHSTPNGMQCLTQHLIHTKKPIMEQVRR